LLSTTSDVEVLVIRPPAGEVEVTCGGLPMIVAGGGRGDFAVPEDSAEVSTLIGKRYEDIESGMELLCAKGGAGALACDGQLMTLRAAKPLPASD
jgi:hypothetical protein